MSLWRPLPGMARRSLAGMATELAAVLLLMLIGLVIALAAAVLG